MKNSTEQITANQLLDCEGGNHIVKGSVEDFLTVFRSMRKSKTALKGRFEIVLTDAPKGTNIHRRNICDAAAVFKPFAPFVRPEVEKLQSPTYDEEGGVLVASDGWRMLITDIPEGLKEAVCHKNGWRTKADGEIVRWDVVCRSGCHFEDGEKSMYRLVADIQKGGKLHGLMDAFRSFAMGYAHRNADNTRTVSANVWIGANMYDTRGVTTLLNSMFGLGCTSVRFYERAYALGGAPMNGGGPIVMVGEGAAVAVKGLAMPLRYPEEQLGLVMPCSDSAVLAA